MKSNAIQAVLFDNDGTLVDSEPIGYAALVDCLARHGIEVELEQTISEWAGVDLHVTLATLQERAAVTLPEDFLDRYRVEQLAALEKGVPPIPGVGELLANLQLPRAVVSNAPRKKMALCLRSAGLMQHLEEQHLYSAYDVGKWKPEPDAYLAAARGLGFAPEVCAVVEDSAAGVEAGRAAGCRVFAYDPAGRLPHWADVACLESMGDLLSHVDG